MKYVLDFKEEVTKLCPDEKDVDETFYRYKIVTDTDITLMTVWFVQQHNGNIFHVGCKLDSPKFEHFNLFFEVPLRDKPYRPTHWTVQPKVVIITNENFYQFHSGLQMLQYAGNCAMTIFEDKEHIR